jgi:L-ascorbate metabolism protein UlaG (beta-lactamase superfamily)
MLERFTWFKQAAFRWEGDGLTVYIVFITHAHFDHFSQEDLERVRKEGTRFLAPHDVARELSGEVTPVAPGDSLEVRGIRVQVVPAYNVVEDRLEFHPKANRWVGYVLELGANTYYHAGDTDHAPELSEVRADVAFLPIGGTYTMDPTEAGGLARAISPQLAVPMHYGFVVGSPSDADRFREAADPVKVEALTPVHPFERG